MSAFYILHIRIKMPQENYIYNRETTSPLQYSIAWIGIKCIMKYYHTKAKVEWSPNLKLSFNEVDSVSNQRRVISLKRYILNEN